jgi:hypothetical protein
MFSSYAIGGKTKNSGNDAPFGEENKPQYDPTSDLSKNRISLLAKTDITLAFTGGTTSNHRHYAKVISLFNVAPANNTMFYACSPS